MGSGEEEEKEKEQAGSRLVNADSRAEDEGNGNDEWERRNETTKNGKDRSSESFLLAADEKQYAAADVSSHTRDKSPPEVPYSDTSHAMSGDINVGDRVADTESDEEKKAVVVLKPDATISEWEVNDDETVADHNPEYDEDSSAVIVAFVEDLDEWWEGWRDEESHELFDKMCERGHKFYAFPRGRLRKLRDLDSIESALEDAGYPTERRGDCVVVEKFGEYVVHPDGTVEGEGSIARNVKKVVDSVS